MTKAKRQEQAPAVRRSARIQGIPNVKVLISTYIEVINDYPHPYPLLLDLEGACPPEDVGGPGGYVYFLEAWYDSEHEEHSAMREWGTGHFKEVFDMEHTNQFMEEILKLKKLKK